MDNDKLQPVTILLIFLTIVINVIYLLALLIVFIKKIKILLKSKLRMYYYTLLFYIISKFIIAAYISVNILMGFSNDWEDVSGTVVEKLFKNALVFGDLSLIEMFLISFEYYLAICFSLLSEEKAKKIYKLCLKTTQLATFVLLLSMTIVFNVNDSVAYLYLNITCMGLNLISIITFLVSFFYLNFQMTGVMIDDHLHLTMKKIYKMVLVLLVSRSIMFTCQLVILFEISTGTFISFIAIISGKENEYVILGACFIAYLLFILLTEGIPVMLSLRNSVVIAYDSKESHHRESILSSNTSVINQPFLDSSQELEKEDDIIELKSFQVIQRIPTTTTMWSVSKAQRKQKLYLLREIKSQISNYVIQEIQSEMQSLQQLNIKTLNKLSLFKEDNSIYIFEHYRQYSLDEVIEKSPNIADQLRVCLKVALAIQTLHNKDIVHGCLKPNNIRFDHSQQVYLLGYGLESLKKYLSLTTDYTNKSFYTAVELLNDRNHVILRPKKPSDIYSLGMIIYEAITNNKKYRSLSLKEVKQKFGVEKIRPKIPESVEENSRNLMRNCWQEDPNERPTISYVIDVLKRLTG